MFYNTNIICLQIKQFVFNSCVPTKFHVNTKNYFYSNADAQAELDQWGLNFDKKLVSLTGRVLPGERIFQGSRSV